MIPISWQYLSIKYTSHWFPFSIKNVWTSAKQVAPILGNINIYKLPSQEAVTGKSLRCFLQIIPDSGPWPDPTLKLSLSDCQIIPIRL